MKITGRGRGRRGHNKELCISAILQIIFKESRKICARLPFIEKFGCYHVGREEKGE